MRRMTAIFAAAVLSLAFSVPAFASTANQVSTETLTVQSTISITGVPASIAYGSGLGGATVTSGAGFTINISGNNPTGITLAWQPSDLTGTPSGTIAATNNRYVKLSSAGAPCATVGASSGYTTAPGKQYIGPSGTAQNIVASTGAATCAVSGVVLSVVIPAAAVPSAYTGTSTFIVSDNP